MIARLCKLERTRAPFAVEATEHLTELTLGGGRVRLRLDRIEGRATVRTDAATLRKDAQGHGAGLILRRIPTL